ncbi:COP1-interactive protein 1 [Camellia lanceoleosa]|uniref:COP1-interactive protein 1 n=1 Tax=Camellia lanceoleosa TaxID=1840588 RepID=A0ACC0G3X1_9ERIC|nr:COP1-interactive protein 1 [Camellia lanceoleosa]
MVTDDIKQELQVADLKTELTETTEEKEAEKMISDLKMEAETLNGENSKLLQELVTECSQLREKLGERERELASHTEMHETHKSETSARTRGLELELDSLHTQKGDEVKLLTENLIAIEEDYGYFESRVHEIMNAFQGAKNRVRELEEQVDSLRNQNSNLEEQLRGKTHETETDQMPGVQEEEERKSHEDEDEDEDDDFEFPTPADEIIPVYPIFGRDELDGVPAGTYCVSGRVKPTVAGGGVTVAQERSRRRRLLMPYRQEGQELQVADLKRELTETTEEKEVEKMISDLKMEAETLNGENSKLLQELVTECS